MENRVLGFSSMKKNALVFGCGGKNGRTIIDVLLENKFNVTNVGQSSHISSNVKNINILWKDLNIKKIHDICLIDDPVHFLFFNQNSSSLSIDDFATNNYKKLTHWKRIKDWSNSLWLSCQLPYITIHNLEKNLSKDSTVGCMVSSYIDYNKVGTEDHPDYSSFKYFNYLSMKCFGEKNNFKTFGIQPDFNIENSETALRNIINRILFNQKNNFELYRF